jgi:hypothetical protein
MSTHLWMLNILCSQPGYLTKYKESLDTYAITYDDCMDLFRAVLFDGGDEVTREKWRLVGQCLSRVCSKRCNWSNLEVRAQEAKVCTFTTSAEEAIVLWLIVSEGEDWLKLVGDGENTGVSDGVETTGSESSANQKKKCGQHKTIAFHNHWLHLRCVVKKRRENREISESWDEAWKMFAIEELEMKNSNKRKRKRQPKNVLPTLDDVLKLGESSVRFSLEEITNTIEL